MYFDPLSAWLVALIGDGIMIAGEQGRGESAAEYHQKNIKQSNDALNADIRRIREKYGLILAEMAYEQIQRYIRVTKKNFSFEFANGQIVIDLDNQEYIIAILEECARRFGEYESVEKYRQKAEWYKNAAIEARRRKELYIKELKESRIREAKERKNQQITSNIMMLIGVIVFIALIFFFIS